MNLKNRIILILGGTGSVGGATAKFLEREGATVVCHGLNSGEWRADLSKDGEAKRLINAISAKYGRVDVVINSIGASLKLAPIEKKNWDDYQAQLEVQLRAAVEITSAVAPIMKNDKKGIILHVITSGVDEVPSHMIDYLTAKYALMGFARASERELARFGIKVLYIKPRFIKNDFTRDMPEKAVEMMEAKGEVTTPEEVAEEIWTTLKS